MSSTDALFTRFEGLFKKYLDSKQFFLLTPEELGIEQASLRQLFYYSWDYGDAPSKQMLLEVLPITYPSGTNEFWGSPAALEDHVLESFALALEALKLAEHTDTLLPQEPQQKSKPGKPADHKIRKLGEIVRKHIHTKKDFFDEKKKQVLLREFEENAIPLPRDEYGLLKYPGSNWQEIMSQSAKWKKVVDPVLERDRSPRKSKITTE